MKFKKWLQLQEVGTGSNAVAVFSRPAIGLVQRQPVEPIIFGDEDKKKKKNKKLI